MEGRQLSPLPVTVDDAAQFGDVAALAVHVVEHAVTVRADCGKVTDGAHDLAFEAA